MSNARQWSNLVGRLDNAVSVGSFSGLPDGSDLPERPENIPIDDESFAAGSVPFTINLPWLGTVVNPY